jgi:(2Fe-2S) ferredoxin
MPHFEHHAFVCVNERAKDDPRGDCLSKGGAKVHARMKQLVHEHGLVGAVRANKSGCLDQCEHGCTVVVYPEQVWYGGVTVDDVEEIVVSHLKHGVPVERLRLAK